MSNHLKFYINGAWVDPVTLRTLDVINPATEEPFTRISIGSAADVDRAIAAARAAVPAFSQTSKADRVALLKRIVECYRARLNDIAQAVSAEMGAPIGMALDSQAAAGLAHLDSTLKALEAFEFEDQRNGTRIVREGIGVVGLITQWNWPLLLKQLCTPLVTDQARSASRRMMLGDLPPSSWLTRFTVSAAASRT